MERGKDMDEGERRGGKRIQESRKERMDVGKTERIVD